MAGVRNARGDLFKVPENRTDVESVRPLPQEVPVKERKGTKPPVFDERNGLVS